MVYLFVSRTFPTSTSGEERVEEEEEEEEESTIESNRIQFSGGVFFGGGCGLSWTTLTVGEKVPRGKR